MTAILPELTRADLAETVVLRRFDDASDVADLVTFLLSAACDSTGRVLEVRSPISLLTLYRAWTAWAAVWMSWATSSANSTRPHPVTWPPPPSPAPDQLSEPPAVPGPPLSQAPRAS
jgi:hypothetical protein